MIPTVENKSIVLGPAIGAGAMLVFLVGAFVVFKVGLQKTYLTVGIRDETLCIASYRYKEKPNNVKCNFKKSMTTCDRKDICFLKWDKRFQVIF